MDFVDSPTAIKISSRRGLVLMSLVHSLTRFCVVTILILAGQAQAGKFDYGSFGEAQAAANSMSQFVDKPVGILNIVMPVFPKLLLIYACLIQDTAGFGQLWQEWKTTYGKSYGVGEVRHNSNFTYIFY